MIFLKKLLGGVKKSRPESGQWVHSEAADRLLQRGGSPLTPERAGELLTAADSGDIQQLCWAASVIELENWDVRQAMEARRNAIAACSWSIVPGDDSDTAKVAAEAFEKALTSAGSGAGDELDTFEDLMSDLMTAVISPFAASEIVWGPGGELIGFNQIDSWHFTLRDSLRPKLITTNEPNGVELPPDKVLIHSYRRGGDLTRRGLIRTLIWLHVFQNFPIKDLLGFVERFGMPFVIAKIDNSSWENERSTIQRLIRAFGPSGGGVFSKSTEIELLQAANNTGEIYFRLLDYTGAAITKVIQGQLASSSVSSGFSNGDAQTDVRDDIRLADARAIQNTVNARLAAPWTLWHYGPALPAPRLQIAAEPAEDRKALAEVVKTLEDAGYETDPVEISEKTGLKLQRKTAAATGDSGNSVGLGKERYDAMGVAIRAGVLTSTPDLEEMVRRELGLPDMSAEVKKSWAATGNLRQPITLKSTEAEAVSDALNVEGSDDAAALQAETVENVGDLADLAAVELIRSGAVAQWLGPMESEIASLVAEENEETLKRRLAALAANPVFGSSAAFEGVLEKQAATGIAEGAIAADERKRRA